MCAGQRATNYSSLQWLVPKIITFHLLLKAIYEVGTGQYVAANTTVPPFPACNEEEADTVISELVVIIYDTKDYKFTTMLWGQSGSGPAGTLSALGAVGGSDLDWALCLWIPSVLCNQVREGDRKSKTRFKKFFQFLNKFFHQNGLQMVSQCSRIDYLW